MRKRKRCKTCKRGANCSRLTQQLTVGHEQDAVEDQCEQA